MCKPAFFITCVRLLLLAVAIGGVPTAVAEPIDRGAEIVFYLEDEPIYTSSSPDAPGFMLEIVNAMLGHLALSPRTEYLPWRRAQALTQRTPNAVIFPLARTPEREASYQWLCKVIDVPVMFINKDGLPRIDSLAQARAIGGVGVILGTPQEQFLKDQQVPHVTYTGEQLYPALAMDRIGAVYTAQPEAVYGWRQGAYLDDLQYGKAMQELSLWIASNRNSDAIKREEWCASLGTIRRNGEFAKVRSRYFDAAPHASRAAVP